MQEYAIVLGSCSVWESRERSGSTVRSAWGSWKPGGGKVFVFLLVSRGCSRGKRETHMEWCGASLMDMMTL